MNAIQRAYTEGFVSKCAQVKVDPETLLETAPKPMLRTSNPQYDPVRQLNYVDYRAATRQKPPAVPPAMTGLSTMQPWRAAPAVNQLTFNSLTDRDQHGSPTLGGPAYRK